MIACGLDRLLAEPALLAGRRYGLLAHAAAVTADCVPAHLALARAGHPPAALFAPEHGYFGVEQDMVPAPDARDPWTGAPILSLYGENEASLRPEPSAFAGLDLLLVDLQDVGARYYTYAATAVWAAAAALTAGCEVWVLDRPNPLGGLAVEGNLRRPGFDSFVGAFEVPIRHGLTLAELVLLAARRERWPALPRVFSLLGWRRSMLWPDAGRVWIAPSPNMPSYATALVYPGLCLLEATELSEGRGTTRPFLLFGAPGLDPLRLAGGLERASRRGLDLLPTYFRPQFHKHAGAVCAGLEIAVREPEAVTAARFGVELIALLRREFAESCAWRREPYEFVLDRPAIDLLLGDDAPRLALESGHGVDAWLASWAADEAGFRHEREAILLYPEHGE